MKASELIKELQKHINDFGDKDVYYWNDFESTFEYIRSTYSDISSDIILDSEEKE